VIFSIALLLALAQTPNAPAPTPAPKLLPAGGFPGLPANHTPKVEIGGFAPFSRTEPPRDEWAKIAKRELDFLLTLGADLPRVAISELEAKRLSPGLIEVKAALLNDALLPVANKAGLRADVSRPLRVKLVLPDGATLVGGSKQTLVRDLGGKSRKELRWLVLCDQPLQIGVSVDSDNAGAAQAMTEVKK
jgi:hypothetical protein